ncbi:hypothetical protein ASPBRDRAFT_197069 [Aspergillus brasiliensis CBS 101740]|uniref:Uncharacterized protein n=1 Tax=Aspergillus brasiliensis (strain CBS 101740 / IMI 381727 / IBT 21946) TaxID=767769 RepID=A0A1L9UFC9_ASPBC|nr:hypothetical protein ASPBRDRAFT_197069 [Aspergillus brasiliensis CBS 101740]
MATDARTEHWISGLKWWFPREEYFSITERVITTFKTAITILTVIHDYSDMTFDIVLGDPDPEDENRHHRILADRLRLPVISMLDDDGREFQPWGATVVGDSTAIYRRIGDLALYIPARFPEEMPKLAANDSPLADILNLIKNDFEDSSVHDDRGEPRTPSTSSEEEPEDESSTMPPCDEDYVPTRANNGAHRGSRREPRRRYSPATERDLGYSSSDIFPTLGDPVGPAIPWIMYERPGHEASDRAWNDQMLERYERRYRN